MLLSSERSLLLVVDVQERLAPAVLAADRVVRNIDILLDSAACLGVPVLASEQYPRGLGPTVADLRGRIPDGAVVEKIHFACTSEPGFLDRLDSLGRDQIVVTGMEAHVCVLQTVLGLCERGRNVFLVADAVSSRAAASVELGIARMRAAGADVVSTEMVVFEWLQRAGTPAFKTLSQRIK